MRHSPISAATVLSPSARVSCLSGMAGERGESTRLHLTINLDLRLQEYMVCCLEASLDSGRKGWETISCSERRHGCRIGTERTAGEPWRLASTPPSFSISWRSVRVRQTWPLYTSSTSTDSRICATKSFLENANKILNSMSFLLF